VIRFLKWLGIGIGGLVLLLVLAALVLPSVINLERYRSALANRAGRALGREVTLGDLRFSLWSGLGAEARTIRISQAPGHGTDPFLTADALRVQVQLLPLFRGQIRVTTAVLARPRILVSRERDGSWNVDDLFRPPAEAPAPRRPAESPRPGKPAALGALLLSEVAIHNGEVTLLDQSRPSPLRLTLADLDLTVRQSQTAEALSIRSQAKISSPGPGRLEASGFISPGGSDGPVLDVTLTLRDAEAGPLLQPFLEKASALQIVGPLAGGIRVSGALPRAAFAGTADLQAAAVRLGEFFQKPAGEEATLRFEGQREGGGVNLPKLTITLKGTTATASVRIPDIQAPRASFTASAATVDLDRLLAKPAPKQAWLGTAVAHAADANPGGPAATGNTAFAAQGRVTVDEVRYLGLAWTGVQADIRYQDRVLYLPEILAGVASGRVTAKGEVDLRPKVPRVALTSRVENLATEPLVKALGLGTWTLKSTLAHEGSVSFSGGTLAEILGSANGSGTLAMHEGRINGYRPLDRLAEVVGPILAAQGIRVRFDEFRQLNGRYSLDKGVLRIPDLTLTKAEGTVTAVGTMGLQDGGLDFDVVARAGRNTIAAKLTGTAREPIVVVKLDKVQQRIEREIDKVLPGEKGKDLKGILRGLFGR
jgi:AsmA protein